MSALIAAPPGAAFEIETDNPDISIHWDNTVRVNLGMRAQSQNQSILKNPNYDDGDRNFSNGSLVTSRGDVLSEFDFVWKRNYGFRVSAAGWWDPSYNSLDNTNTATANTLVNGLPVAGRLSPYTKRYSKGASGEWLDAFAFANFEVGDVPVNIKAGQHTVYWGDSLLNPFHSISYAQNSLDLAKLLATPGTEAKELFRPRGGVTVQAQAAKGLSLAAQWFYNWQAIRIPESGSYLTVQDGLNFGGDSLIIGPNQRLWNAQSVAPSRYSGSLGDFGVSARWRPEWLDGTAGFYYRNATDIQPQLLVTPGVAPFPLPAATCTAIGGQPLGPTTCLINEKATTVADLQKYGKVGTYQTAYGDNIHMYAITLAKEFAGVSVGAELSYRQNMPLISEQVLVLPAALVKSVPGAIATTAIPSSGTPGAMGTTMHGLVNGVWIAPKTALWDTATLLGELTWMQWLSVTQNEAVFKGRSSYTALDKATKNYWGLAFNFTPTWFQVWPGIDMLAPIAWNQGISGNAAVSSGGNDGAGSWSAGVALDIQQKYRFDLNYTGYYGNIATDPETGAMTVPNGLPASLSDRGWVSLTFKMTF